MRCDTLCLSMMQQLNQFDRRLLGMLEGGLALVREPYAHIAAQLGCPQQRVLDRIPSLRGDDGLIRRITGVFDAAALGYTQSLVAMTIAPDQLDAAGAKAATHPGVSHCYGRDGRFNLWFTLAVSPRSALGLDRTAELLCELCTARAAVTLPATKRYKLNVRFAAPSGPAAEPLVPARSSPGRPAEPTTQQIIAIHALQEDLPARGDPFAPLADSVGLDPDALLVHAADFLTAGWMRRYAAILHHRAAGAKANVLVAWCVDAQATDRAGRICAADLSVSHCYLRTAGQDWAYNLYTMIHAPDRAEAQRTIGQLSAAMGEPERAQLWTLKEYTKRRIRLFTAAEREWETRHGT